MHTFVVLLRGINVGGHNKIKMIELKALLEKSGFTNVLTYIQSGNIIVNKDAASSNEISGMIHSLIQTKYGYDISVMTVAKPDFISIYNSQPWKSRVEEEIKFLHVTICEGKMVLKNQAKLQERLSNSEELEIIENAIYLYCPNGYSNTKITNSDMERILKVRATTRNWNTMTKLIALLSEY